MNIEAFYEPGTGSWSYLLADESDRRAAIIDPVWLYDPVSGMADTAFTDAILRTAAERRLAIDYVLETHAHADHLSCAGHVRERTGAQVLIGQGIREVQATFARVFNLSGFATDGSQFDGLLAEGDVVAVGSLAVRVLETPGHTRDSLAYLVGDAAFVGDTVFAPRYGTARCDFPGGDAAMLFDSISRLHALPGETRLFLCHDYPKGRQAPVGVVTVAESRQSNIHVGEDTRRDDFIALREQRDAGLGPPRLIYPALQVNIRAGRAPSPEGNGIAYLRVPFNGRLDALVGKGSD